MGCVGAWELLQGKMQRVFGRAVDRGEGVALPSWV